MANQNAFYSTGPQTITVIRNNHVGANAINNPFKDEMLGNDLTKEEW